MTETELCAEFMAWAREQGHRCYPEWAGWDILVETKQGLQVGIEAKTSASMKVLAQALKPQEHMTGPDYHAVLVPKASGDFHAVARSLRIWVIEWDRVSMIFGGRPIRHRLLRQFATQLDQLRPHWHDAKRWHHGKQHEPPPVEELNAPAGVPSPSGLTWWKVQAIKLCLRLETNGYVTTSDFKALGISAGATWINRWIEWDGTKLGRHHRYVAIAKPMDPRPDTLHPEVATALREKEEF